MANMEKEIGNPGGVQVDAISWGSTKDAKYSSESLDPNPDLRFPNNIPVYDEMRNTDGRIASLLNACSLPILGAKWRLEGDGVRPEVLEFVKSELGLVEAGESLARTRRKGIVWTEHLEQALMFMPFGFMPFEQVYEVGNPRPDQSGLGLDYVLHLRKLAPRLPTTISKIMVGRDGGLKAIKQVPLLDDLMRFEDIEIPVERLVMYCLRREGGDWSGRSVLRAAYGPYLINSHLKRLYAMIIERNGMGIPVVSYDTQLVSKDDAEALGAGLRAGEASYAAMPIGTSLTLQGVTGTLVDPLPFIKENNEDIAAGALAMVLTLGHDSGARSLGDTFNDMFLKSVQTIANSIATTATEHVIRDLVELNFGPAEPYPSMVAGDLTQNDQISTSALKELADAGLIVPDDKLEAFLRTRENLPEKDTATARTKAEPAPAAMAEHSAQMSAIQSRLLGLSVGAHV